MKSLIQQFLIIISFCHNTFSQHLEFNFEFEKSLPSMDSILRDCSPEEDNQIFYFHADTLYHSLMNISDTIVTFDFGNEYLIDVLFTDYTVAAARVPNPSGAYSKKGRIVGNDSSIVYAHFTPEYFWMEISLGIRSISIFPIRSISQSLMNYGGLYIFQEIEDSYSQPFQSSFCEDLFIEIYVIADNAFSEKFDNDHGFIIDNTKAHLMRFEKFLNQTFRPAINDGEIQVKAVVIDIDEDINMYSSDSYQFDLVRNRFASRNYNYYPCLFPDLYLGLTGLNLNYSGLSHRATACSPEPPFQFLPDYPGLSVVNFSNASFEYTEDLSNRITTTIAHELCHQFGADDLNGSDCGANCGNPLTCSLMCTTGCNRFQLDNCSKNTIKGHFDNNCTNCYTAFTEEEACVHCEISGDFVIKTDFPVIMNCENENYFTIEFVYQNDCDASITAFTLPYKISEVELVAIGNFTDDENLGFGERALGLNVFLNPEEKITLYAVFKLKSNLPSNNNQVTNLQNFDLLVREGGITIYNINTDDIITYVVPRLISGIQNLSSLLEPQTGYFFDSENISGCHISNVAFRVNETLNIDNDYCFNNTTIILEDEASIVVKGGYELNLNNCEVRSCSNMSNGILLEEGASMEVKNSKISDAIVAIQLSNGSSLISKNTKYLNNWIGISSQLLNNESANLQVLEGNEFSSNNMKIPYKNMSTLAGISISNNTSTSLILGSSDPFDLGINRFSNCLFGIMLNHSNAVINNFIMTDINIDPDYSSQHGGTGIQIFKNIISPGNSTVYIGNNNSTKNEFSNCKTAIESSNTNLVVNECRILNSDYGIRLKYPHFRNSVYVSDNFISTKKAGIQLSSPGDAKIEINNNEFVCSTISYSYAIQALRSNKEIDIYSNRISLSGRASGIEVIDSRDISIRLNQIYFVQPNLLDHKMSGVSLFSSKNCQITKNRLSGYNLEENTVGYLLQDSPYNLLHCNTASHVGVCEQHIGLNSMTNSGFNDYGLSKYGLLLGSEAVGSEAITGTQFHRRNTWPSTYEFKPAWTLSNDPQTNILSNYIVDPTNSYNYSPDNINELVNIQWFTKDENDFVVPKCSWFPRDNYWLPEDNFLFEVNSIEKNKLLKLQLQEALQFGLLDSVLDYKLDTFYISSEDDDIGKQAKSSYYLYKAMTDSISNYESHISNALFYNTSSFDSDSITTLGIRTNEILAEYLLEQDIEVLFDNKEFILETGFLCPFKYGSSVYTNRSLAKEMNLDVEFSDSDLCGEIEPRSSAEINVWSFKIYPNPISVNEEFNISFENEVITVMISDMLGKIFYIKDIGNENLLSISLRYPGLYIVTLLSNTGEKRTGKLLIYK